MLEIKIELILCVAPVAGAVTKAFREVSAGVIDTVCGTILVTATKFGAAIYFSYANLANFP
jgi:tRNA-dihydrouridine synthase